MTLATRCPSCGTVFRVVQDQLRVSEGWVRCGRCNGVFDAAEVLFDIDSGAPVPIDLGLPAAPPAALPAQAPAPVSPRPSAPPAEPPAWPGDRQEPAFDIGAAPGDLTLDGEPLLRARSRDDDDALRPAPADDASPEGPPGASAGDRLDEIVITDHVPAPPEPPEPPAAGDTAAAEPGIGGPAAASLPAIPSFMRTAQRTALWRRPVVRSLLALGVLGLAVALAAQLAVLWRDSLAARWPASTPALTALCQLAGCSVQPLRRIEALSVHSSGLNRLEGSTLYRLQVVLQNRADTAVMMPALELSLTDAQGRLVLRRVLQAAELGATQPVLQAGEELPIKALMSTGERRVEGYTLELFYP